MSNDLHRFHSIHFYGLIWWDSTGTFCLGLLWYAIDCSGMFVVSHDRFWYTLHSALFVQFTIQLAIQHVHWEWCELPRKLTLQWRHNKQRDGVSIVCLTGCSGADQRKHRNSASLTFVRGVYRWPVDSLYKGPVTWKMFPLDDVIMKKYCDSVVNIQPAHGPVASGTRTLMNKSRGWGCIWDQSIQQDKEWAVWKLLLWCVKSNTGFWSIHNEKEIVKMSHTNDVGMVFKLDIFPSVCI